MPTLTMQQIQLFRNNGFLCLPECLPEETVEALKNAIRDDIDNEVEPIVRNKDGRAIRISAIMDRDSIFRDAATHSTALDPLESLLGPNIEIVTNRHNHATLRTAGENKGASLHRDVKQWSRTIFTIIFYLEETTVENGCTRIIPGSHHFPGTSESLYDTDWAEDILSQALPVPMPAGGMLVIDSMVIHGPGHNHTDDTRMSMTVGYHSVDDLMDIPNPKRLLVRGEGSYRGNDLKY
jgi:ectoine hydroxylase-related dioxygenase (phytanoyl-CoA dioxygenase family)